MRRDLTITEVMDIVSDVEKHFTTEKTYLGDLEFNAEEIQLPPLQGKAVGRKSTQILLRSSQTTDWSGLGPIGFSGLAERTGIPPTYLERCPPDLALHNLNYWKAKRPRVEMQLRMSKRPIEVPRVQAVVSHSYQEVPNLPILSQIAHRLPNLVARKFSYDEDYGVFMRAVDPTKVDIGGELFEKGFFMRNSDTGVCEVELRALLHVLICTNGLMRVAAGEMYSHRHIGRISSDDVVMRGVRLLEEAEKIAEPIAAQNEERWEEPEALTNWLRVNGMDKAFSEQVVKHLTTTSVERGPAPRALSRWWVADSITRLSQHVPQEKKAFDYKMIAGKVLALHAGSPGRRLAPALAH